MTIEVLENIKLLAREKGIEEEILIDALKNAIEAAARKKLDTNVPLQIEFSRETGQIEVFSEKTVTDDVINPEEEILSEEARLINPKATIGETLLVKLPIKDFGRIAAQLAKQVIVQKVREAEIDLIYNDYIDKKGELINGMVQRMEHGDLIVDLGKAEGVLPRREQVFRESFNRGERIRAYVLDVRKTPKNALVILSRTHIGLIRGLFEMEVPEISEGMVEIMGVVREPNGRTKISVRTNEREIDAVGACVGMRGMRVQSIVQELRGEKIDIVEFSEDPETYLKNALSPAKVSRIIMNPDEKQMTVIVAEDQMSLAIGKKGQNVRLAAKLVRWKVDIKGPSEAMELGQHHAFLTPAEASTVDFLDDVKNAKGLGEKVMTILFSNDLVTYEEALIRGVKGLTQLTGIGPKKAEALIQLAEEQKKQSALEKELAKETSIEAEKSMNIEDLGNVTEAREQKEEISAEDADGDAAEEEEVLIQELIGLTPDVLKVLADNGFETIAELSVTPLDELIAMEGVDEKMGKSILEQVKQRLENTESV